MVTLPRVVLIGLGGTVIYRAGITLELSWERVRVREHVPAGVGVPCSGESKLDAGSYYLLQDKGIYLFVLGTPIAVEG